MKRAYLDIETTGLSRVACDLTVVGVAVERGDRLIVRHLIGGEITEPNLLAIVRGVDRIYTYNGSRFDLPFIKARLGLDLCTIALHTDLMYACWKRKLKGGLKAVERILKIPRKRPDIDGWMAVRLWYDYTNHNNRDSLRTLIDYNAEDVINLKELRIRLGVD